MQKIGKLEEKRIKSQIAFTKAQIRKLRRVVALKHQLAQLQLQLAEVEHDRSSGGY